MRKEEIKIPLYGGELVIIQCENWEYIKDQYKYALEKYSNQPDERHDGYVFENNLTYGRTQYIVAFKGTPKGSVIAHECVHLVNHVYESCVIPLDIYNDEHQAYLLEWFFDKIDAFFKEKKTESDTTITLKYEEKSWPLKIFTPIRGIRAGCNRPDTVVIDCYEVADSQKLGRIIEYLNEIKLAMQ